MNILKRIDVILLAVLAAILPNIVFMKIVDQPKDSIFYLAFPKGEKILDFFSYYKAIFLIIMTVIILIAFILKSYKSFKAEIFTGLMLIYSFFLIISTILSKYPVLSLRGNGERFEGLVVLLCYIVIFIITIASVKTKDDFNTILAGIIFGSIVVGLIGIFQYYDMDLWRSDLGKKIILGSNYDKFAPILTFSFGKYSIYSTLYNTNFVGSYMIMMVFIGAGLFTYFDRWIYKILSLIYFSLMYFNLLGSNSRAGVLAGIAIIIYFAIFFRKIIIKNYKNIVILVFFAIIISYTMQVTSDGKLKASMTKEKESYNTLREITETKNGLQIITKDKNLLLRISNNRLDFYANGNKLLTSTQKAQFNNSDTYVDLISFNNNDYKDFKFVLDKRGIIFYYNDLNPLRIGYNGQTYFGYGFGNNQFPYLAINREKNFDGYEKRGSGRIYIWSRTIPLLREAVLYGYGIDTFSIIFPQHDIVGKHIGFGRQMVVDKPHNMYLQIAMNSGMLSMFLFISACLYFMFLGYKYFRNIKDKEVSIFLFTYLGVLGYLAAGMFNDSLVSVAPIFWILWGLTIAGMNIYNKEKV